MPFGAAMEIILNCSPSSSLSPLTPFFLNPFLVSFPLLAMDLAFVTQAKGITNYAMAQFTFCSTKNKT